jgi:hypothetical protein
MRGILTYIYCTSAHRSISLLSGIANVFNTIARDIHTGIDPAFLPGEALRFTEM